MITRNIRPNFPSSSAAATSPMTACPRIVLTKAVSADAIFLLKNFTGDGGLLVHSFVSLRRHDTSAIGGKADANAASRNVR